MASKSKSTEKEFAVETEDQTVAPPVQQELMVQIPLQMAINTINMIDMMSTRGVFKGEELLGVGVTRQRMFEAVQPFITPAQ